MPKTSYLRKVLTTFALCAFAGMVSSAQAQGPGIDYDNGSDFGESSEFEGRGGYGRFRGGYGGDRSRYGGDGEEGWGGRYGRGGGRGWGGPGEEMNAEDFSRTATSAAALGGRERITIVLPESFRSLDLDRDGQIGLYEWRQLRRADMQGFLALDHNGDGYLTPAELVRGPRNTSVAGMSRDPSTFLPGSQPVSAPGSGMGGGAPMGASSGSPPSSGGSGQARIGASRFQLLDSNRNGTIDPEEWQRATNMRGQFEKAGIDLASPMSKDDFIKHFIDLNPPKS